MVTASIRQLVAAFTVSIFDINPAIVTCFRCSIGAVIAFENVGSIVLAIQRIGAVVTFRGIAAIAFPGVGFDPAFSYRKHCTAWTHPKMIPISIAYQSFINAGGFVIFSGAYMRVLPAEGAVPSVQIQIAFGPTYAFFALFTELIVRIPIVGDIKSTGIYVVTFIRLGICKTILGIAADCAHIHLSSILIGIEHPFICRMGAGVLVSAQGAAAIVSIVAGNLHTHSGIAVLTHILVGTIVIGDVFYVPEHRYTLMLTSAFSYPVAAVAIPIVHPIVAFFGILVRTILAFIGMGTVIVRNGGVIIRMNVGIFRSFFENIITILAFSVHNRAAVHLKNLLIASTAIANAQVGMCPVAVVDIFTFVIVMGAAGVIAANAGFRGQIDTILTILPSQVLAAILTIYAVDGLPR